MKKSFHRLRSENCGVLIFRVKEFDTFSLITIAYGDTAVCVSPAKMANSTMKFEIHPN